MSLIANIDHLFATPGVSAISISEDPRLPSQFRGLLSKKTGEPLKGQEWEAPDDWDADTTAVEVG